MKIRFNFRSVTYSIMLLDSGELIVPLVVLIKSVSWLLFMPLSTSAFDKALSFHFILSRVLQTVEANGRWISVDQICMGSGQPILDFMPVRSHSGPWEMILLEMESGLRFKFLPFLSPQGSVHTR